MMKKFFAFLILSALCMAATAQTGPGVDAVTISGANQAIVLPDKIYRVGPEDFRAFKGTYILSNGKILYLSSMGRKMYAEVAGSGRSEIVAATANTFVALDRKMDLSFSPPTGIVTDVKLRIVASEQASNDAPMAVVTLLAHR